MPRYPPCFQNPGPLRNTAYGFPLLCINYKGWGCMCWGTWTSFRVFYQIWIQFSLLFCGFFHHRNIQLLFVPTHRPHGPAKEDTLSISYATKVTKLPSYKTCLFSWLKHLHRQSSPTQKHCAAEPNPRLDFWIVPLISISILQLK